VKNAVNHTYLLASMNVIMNWPNCYIAFKTEQGEAVMSDLIELFKTQTGYVISIKLLHKK